ncbi:GyrI-like domain-containing protein [Cohnella caldifontis]|uniref:GyrI-like domain-containing protein n=1 Tax=Cohnella caldifontis TaxID=3027471 RepID=UPI0023EAC414|nr:GyrI-like domain-containing protein [Cohnella sp. YIM B05605]
MKLDMAKTDKAYYSATDEPALAEFPELPYLTIEDRGSPDGDVFANAVEALYSVAYGVKGLCKKVDRDFTVSKLEGFWWWADAGKQVHEVPREEWCWKLLIRMPDFVDGKLAETARTLAAEKKKDLEPIARVAFERIREGVCVQVLHTGPYRTEPETMEKAHAFMERHGYAHNGLEQGIFHHEIYLSDPRRTKESARKTILRFPVKPIG